MMIRGWRFIPSVCRLKNGNIRSSLHSCGCRNLSTASVKYQRYPADQQESKLSRHVTDFKIESSKQKENDYMYLLLQEKPKYDSYFLSKYPISLSPDGMSSTDCQYHIQKILASTISEPQDVIKALLVAVGSSQSDRGQLLTSRTLLAGVHTLSSNISNLNDDELLLSMALISQLYFRKAHLFGSDVSEYFFQVCEQRYRNWGRRRMLLAVDFFFCFMADRHEASGFINAVVAEVHNHLQKLNVEELVLLMFHINLMRRIPNYSFEIEDEILNKFSELSPDELAVICLGFFKTNSKIQSQTLIANLGQRYLETSSTLSSYCLSAFLKCFKKSVRKDISRKNKDFNQAVCTALPEISKRIQDLPIPTAMHALTFYEHIQFVSEEFLHNFYQRILSDDFDNWRLKDISSVINIMSSLQYYGADRELFFSRFVESLNREERHGERCRFLGCLLSSLIGLASYDEYPHQLLDLFFTDVNIRNMQCFSLDYAHDLCFLYHSVRIDCPDYQFTRLSEEMQQTLAKNDCLHRNINKTHHVVRSQISVREALLMELKEELNHIFINKDFYKLEFLLPHTQTPDFELRRSGAGRLLPVSEWSDAEVTKSALRKSPTDSLSSLLMNVNASKRQQSKIAILLWWPFCYYLLEKTDGEKTLKLLGFYEMKRRQLQRSGYQIVEIPYFEFNRTLNRAKYLKFKMDDTIRPLRGLKE